MGPQRLRRNLRGEVGLARGSLAVPTAIGRLARELAPLGRTERKEARSLGVYSLFAPNSKILAKTAAANAVLDAYASGRVPWSAVQKEYRALGISVPARPRQGLLRANMPPALTSSWGRGRAPIEREMRGQSRSIVLLEERIRSLELHPTKITATRHAKLLLRWREKWEGGHGHSHGAGETHHQPPRRALADWAQIMKKEETRNQEELAALRKQLAGTRSSLSTQIARYVGRFGGSPQALVDGWVKSQQRRTSRMPEDELIRKIAGKVRQS